MVSIRRKKGERDPVRDLIGKAASAVSRTEEPQPVAAAPPPQPQQQTSTPTEKPKTPEERKKEGQAALGKIEQEKSRLMRERGLTERGAAREIALTGGTERLFPQQRTVAQVQEEEALLAQAQQGRIGATGAAGLETPGGILDPTTLALNVPSIASGVAGGAGLGFAVGNVPGAVLGGAIGGVTAYLGKLSVDRRQITKNAKQVYDTSTGERYNEILAAAKSGANPADVMLAYDSNLENIRESHRALRELTRNKVEADLSGAMDELLESEMWLEREPEYRRQVLIALAQQNTAQVL